MGTERQPTRHDLEVAQAVHEGAAEVGLPPTPHDLRSPDWTILGVGVDGGVRVYASGTLTFARVTALVGQVNSDLEANPTPWRDAPKVTGYRFTTVMGDVWVAEGRTYGEAIRKLFETWSPDVGGLELDK